MKWNDAQLMMIVVETKARRRKWKLEFEVGAEAEVECVQAIEEKSKNLESEFTIISIILFAHGT